LGHDTSEVVGKPAAAFIHPDDFSRISEFFRQTIMTGNKASGIEYRVQHKNGTWQWHSQSISPVYDAGGRVIAVQGICHDITEKKSSVVALRRANRQLTLLAGVTRHDILNKVSTARGYLGIAEMKCGDPSQAEFLKKTDAAITEIKSQIEFTKVYEDVGAHDPQWIDLDTVMPRPYVPATITLDADIQGVMLFSDPMLGKVFFNLLDNSLRHGEHVTEIRVSSHPSAENLVVVWEDNGTGVAADEKERIFERGFGKNTGLGLFLVREILSLTGITITETGEPGKGARFEIVVPNGAYRSPDSK
jgi:PAS domain S-box-containing protein